MLVFVCIYRLYIYIYRGFLLPTYNIGITLSRWKDPYEPISIYMFYVGVRLPSIFASVLVFDREKPHGAFRLPRYEKKLGPCAGRLFEWKVKIQNPSVGNFLWG